MPAPTVATGFTNVTSIAYSANRDVAVIGERGGRLTLLDLLRPVAGGYEQRVVGEGYHDINHLSYDDTTDRLVLADVDGMWVARLSQANRADASAFAQSPDDVRAMGISQAAVHQSWWCSTELRRRTWTPTTWVPTRAAPLRRC